MFSFLYRIAGVDVEEGDEYPHVNIFARFFLHIFRNSIGDIKPPEY